jgi:hypothetical protein
MSAIAASPVSQNVKLVDIILRLFLGFSKILQKNPARARDHVAMLSGQHVGPTISAQFLCGRLDFLRKILEIFNFAYICILKYVEPKSRENTEIFQIVYWFRHHPDFYLENKRLLANRTLTVTEI